MRRAYLALALALSAGAFAQTKIATCPPACASRDGNSLYSIAFSYDSIRFFQLIGSVDHGLKLGAKVFAVSVRRDAADVTQYAARSAPYEVYMSNTTRLGSGATAVLQANHGTPRMLVMKKKTINFPLSPKPSVSPAPWGPTFNLDVPFLVLNMNSICVEFVALGPNNPQSPWMVDREWPATTGKGTSPKISGSTSCGQAGTLEVDVGTLFPGANIWYRVDGISPASYHGLPAFGVVATSKTQWGPLNLPFDLSPLGATGCKLYVGPWLFLMTGKVTVPAPTAMHNIDLFLPTPSDPNLLGAKFYGQAGVVNLSANPLGIELTQGEECNMATNMPSIDMSYAYSYNVNATSGLAYLDRGVVLGLHWQ
jgi:hypothetical protein